MFAFLFCVFLSNQTRKQTLVDDTCWLLITAWNFTRTQQSVFALRVYLRVWFTKGVVHIRQYIIHCT